MIAAVPRPGAAAAAELNSPLSACLLSGSLPVTCLAQPSSIHAGFLAGKSAKCRGSSYPMVSDTSGPGMRWRSLRCAAVLLLAVHPQVIVRLQTGKTWRIVWSLTALPGA
jgi:hypothetical protein